MESDGHVQPGTLVNATSRPRFIANQTRSQPFVLTPLLRQVAVESVRRTGRTFRKKVPGHAAEHMVDRVRVVVVVFLADVGEHDWYVSYPGCSPRTWRRTRLRSKQHPTLLLPRCYSTFQNGPQTVA